MSCELITLGNYLIENYATLEFSGATGCRCGGCSSWQIRDHDERILLEREDLADLVKEIANVG